MVLPRHGFEGTHKGAFQMMQQFNAFNDNEEFQTVGFQLNTVLGLMEEQQEQLLKMAQEKQALEEVVEKDEAPPNEEEKEEAAPMNVQVSNVLSRQGFVGLVKSANFLAVHC